MTELLLFMVAMVVIAASGAATAWATRLVFEGRRLGRS